MHPAKQGETMKEQQASPEVNIHKQRPENASRFFILIRKTGRFFGKTAAYFFTGSVLLVLIFRFVNPPVTYLMIKRTMTQLTEKKPVKLQKKWVSLDHISPHLVQAVVAAEDNNFLFHRGIDMEAIRKAWKLNERSRHLHGASTITQQTAKNVFLWPARSYVRKAFELYFTALIEIFWGKKRIMEVYLNVVETGNGLYGAEAASQAYFHKPAANLNASEAALLAAILPSPRKRDPAHPSAYLINRSASILERMNKIEKIKW